MPQNSSLNVTNKSCAWTQRQWLKKFEISGIRSGKLQLPTSSHDVNHISCDSLSWPVPPRWLFYSATTMIGITVSPIRRWTKQTWNHRFAMGKSSGHFIKFPRTPHLCGSVGTKDDKTLDESQTTDFLSKPIIILEEKIDGSNVGIHSLWDNLNNLLIVYGKCHRLVPGFRPFHRQSQTINHQSSLVGFPSGQGEETINLPATLSEVRILPLP